VGLASRGLRDMDDGPQEIGDKEIEAAVRRQARRVYGYSLAGAVALTAVALAIPGRG
jgi:hypothetical protein